MSPKSSLAKEIFLKAIEITDDTEQRAFLEAACAGDSELLSEVEELLEHHSSLGSFLQSQEEQPTDQGMAFTRELEETSREIGPYKLLQKIGEGGMGVVYMAEQTQPVRRLVALKIIKPGMDTKQVLARFEAERQALALMDHPNIAKVLDGGAIDVSPRRVQGHEDRQISGLERKGLEHVGRPFFVMELVKGVPITKFCDDRRLSIEERIRLFIPVCQAVQHAHQKGVIHRDLKPSNVLVALYDGIPAPKIIDFGIAKATGSKLTERTLFTEFGSVVGTLEYMSPEQAELSQIDVDTRSDVYTLGVLLYELLTGTTPLDTTRMNRNAVLEMLRVIREIEPPKPSTRLSTTDALPSIAANRAIEPKKLTGQLKGELDWIVMKCLEKDRSRRYETANGLSLDLQRYLANEPVSACPPSAVYRIRKFIDRHRIGVASATGFVLLLIAATSFSSWMAYRAIEAERLTAKSAAAAKSAESEARNQADRALKFAAFLKDNVLSLARPKDTDGGLGRDVTIEQAIDHASKGIREAFAAQPLAEAEVCETFGKTYYHLGRYEDARKQYERAWMLRKDLAGENDPLVFDCEQTLAYLDLNLGRVKEAETRFRDTIARQVKSLPPDHPILLETKNNFGLLLWQRGDFKEAEKIHREVLQARLASTPADSASILTSKNNLALALRGQNKAEEAELLYRQVIDERRRKHGAEHPETLNATTNLALLLSSQSRFAEAEKLLTESLEISRRALGTKHPTTLRNENNLAVLFMNSRRWSEAEPVLRHLLPQLRAIHASDHMDVLVCQYNLALALALQKKNAEAEPLFRDTVAAFRRTQGRDSLNTLSAAERLASVLLDLSRWNDAEQLLRECLPDFESKHADHWLRFQFQVLLGHSLTGKRQFDEAEAQLLAGYRGLIDRESAITPEARKRIDKCLERIVALYDAWEKPAEQQRWRNELKQRLAKDAPPDANGPVGSRATDDNKSPGGKAPPC